MSTQKAPRPETGGFERFGSLGAGPLLRRDHFLLRSGWDLLELRQRAKSRGFWFAGAAAGSGKEGEHGSARRKKNADHGLEVENFKKWNEGPERATGCPLRKSIGTGVLSRLSGPPYLAGATYPGAVGAGLLLQQEVASRVPAAAAARAAILTSFMCLESIELVS